MGGEKSTDWKYIDMKRRLGFIGLGTMGKPMATNLIKAGYPVVVHNRSRGPVKELEALGAEGAISSREVAEKTDLVVTMLPDSLDVIQVVLGAGGVLEGAGSGYTIIDMSTISPLAAQEIAEKAASKQISFLDAPVSGGQKGAIEGSLSIMVGGDRRVFESCLDIFKVLGKNIVYIGGVSMGQTAKACNQIVVASTLEAWGEALVLARKAGLDLNLLVKALSGGFAGSHVLDVRGPHILADDFQPGFKARLHYKDLRIALEAGDALGVALPVTSLVHQMFGALKATGRGDLDHSAIVKLLEDLAQVRLTGSDRTATPG